LYIKNSYQSVALGLGHILLQLLQGRDGDITIFKIRHLIKIPPG
jgi:hypothetical protein